MAKGQLLVREVKTSAQGRYALVVGVLDLQRSRKLGGDVLMDVEACWRMDGGLNLVSCASFPQTRGESWEIHDFVKDGHKWVTGQGTVVVESTRNNEFTTKADRALKIVSKTAEDMQPGEASELLAYLEAHHVLMPEFDSMKLILGSIIALLSRVKEQ